MSRNTRKVKKKVLLDASSESEIELNNNYSDHLEEDTFLEDIYSIVKGGHALVIASKNRKTFRYRNEVTKFDF